MAAGPGLAATAASPVAHGVLANNPIALAFEHAPPKLPPSTVLVGRNGLVDIRSLFGRTLLIVLWAEWCEPCMAELSDLARLQSKYGNDKFAIVPILSRTRKQLTPRLIAQLFGFLHADIFEPLMENNWASDLLEAMGGHGWMVALPCHILVAPDGHVVGRQIGVAPTPETLAAAPKSDPERNRRYVERAESGATVTWWADYPGEEFAAAMANGFLG
jgi:thiol-disulfide isomerase/thioredoxin